MKIIKGDITNETTGCILQSCNTIGAYGSGLAGCMRRKFPITYEKFLKNGTGKHLLGTIDIIDVTDTLTVINGYGQEKCGNDGAVYADLQSVESVIRKACLYAHLYGKQLKTVKIGCELGGLDWASVQPFFEKYEAVYGIDVEIYEL